jgi:oxygen-independent coproporphyrinogen-3 oxidase
VEYIAAITRGEAAGIDQRTLSQAERLEEALFMGLRLTAGVNLTLVGARYGVDVWARYGPDLARFAEQGLLIYDRGNLRMTREGMLLANEIMAVFIGATVR